jgi:hypothetical protein
MYYLLLAAFSVQALAWAGLWLCAAPRQKPGPKRDPLTGRFCRSLPAKEPRATLAKEPRT